MNLFVRRTYEPLKFLGRLFWVPLSVVKGTPPVTYAVTWEPDGEHRWGPTLVFKVPLVRLGIGLGVWLDSGIDDLEEERLERHRQEAEDADYDVYQAVNGPVDRERWQRAREAVAAQGLDPSEEMEMMQSLGILE